MSRIYSEPGPLGRGDLVAARRNRDLSTMREAMVSLALTDSDWRWVQQQLLELTRDPDGSVRSIAALSLGHIARVNGDIDRTVVLPVLNGLLDDPDAGGNAANALDDIEIFARGG